MCSRFREIERAKRLFGAEHANVQPHSGSNANFAAYLALAEPSDAIMAMKEISAVRSTRVIEMPSTPRK
jgi:glycine/serine hydroxymethyltransferase